MSESEEIAGPRSFEEILHLAAGKDPDDEAYWDIIRILEKRLPEIFPDLKAASRNPDASVREAVATVLGQNMVKDKVLRAECMDVHLGMLSVDQPVPVLSSIIFAMSHLDDPRSIPAALPFVNHEDASVRYALTSALSCHEDERAIQALITLSRDEDWGVRNWATFDLGSLIATDTPAIRQALLDRLGEEDAEIRGEALRGLAARCDSRVIPALLEEMNLPHTMAQAALVRDAAYEVMKRAANLGAEWQPVLEKCRELYITVTYMKPAKPDEFDGN